MFFACIYIPDFPVQAFVRGAPELCDQAVAVLEGTPPLLTVIAANARAHVAGIELGMTKLQAEACPGVVLRRRSIAQEDAAHAGLLDCALGFSPRVEGSRDAAFCASNRKTRNAARFPDTVVLDITGLDRLFGPPAKIARALTSRAAGLGLAVNVAIAGNPDAAIHAARGFAGITIIPGGTEARHLGVLPVDLLEATPEVLDTLEHWGIRDFRGLAALPEVALSQRLGQAGLRLQQLAQGRSRRNLVPVEPAIQFEEVIELEDAVELLEPLAFVLNRLLDQLCARLKARALAANELRLTMELAKHEEQSLEEQAQNQRAHHRSLRFPVPIEDSRTLLKLLQLDLAAHPPGAPVKKITITAEPAPPRFAQAGLFLPRGPEPERLELTLARIRSIVGESRVGSAELLDTHAPGAFRMVAFTPNRTPCGRTGHSDSTGRSSSGPRTAMRIFRPPLPARVQMKNGMPERVILRGVAHRVTAAAGPWRNSGGWWTEKAWTREEWDVELKTPDATPSLLRMYRNLASAKWFAEGMFD
jgi:protein ImuB